MTLTATAVSTKLSLVTRGILQLPKLLLAMVDVLIWFLSLTRMTGNIDS